MNTQDITPRDEMNIQSTANEGKPAARRYTPADGVLYAYETASIEQDRLLQINEIQSRILSDAHELILDAMDRYAAAADDQYTISAYRNAEQNLLAEIRSVISMRDESLKRLLSETADSMPDPAADLRRAIEHDLYAADEMPAPSGGSGDIPFDPEPDPEDVGI